VIPERVSNHIDGEDVPAASGEWLDKYRPADGSLLCRAARSGTEDVAAAVAAARRAQPDWAAQTVVSRGELCRDLALALRDQRERASEVVAAETGKSLDLARGETDAAIEMGFFMAGEGRRFYGRTTTASMPQRTVMSVRQPLGVAGLLISFNTPLPNVAWKVFPAILCGNACVLKPSEHAPASAHALATLCCRAGLPDGVLNVVQGLGPEAGAALVEHPDVDLVSFTGSAATGRSINETAGRRLAKICLELGGKNALVVCDDADLDNAVRWALASAFSNAGQRCASASRIVVFDPVYDPFRQQFVAEARVYDPGPVISESALERLVAAGAERLDRPGYWVASSKTSGPARTCPARSCSGRSRSSTACGASTRRSRSSTSRRTA
jgi:acyl-CoA reductase-like NAD-dependent aldehyde dehydrogenase